MPPEGRSPVGFEGTCRSREEPKGLREDVKASKSERNLRRGTDPAEAMQKVSEETRYAAKTSEHTSRTLEEGLYMFCDV